MPGLVRKVIIVAAAEGLLLLPSGPNARSSTQRSRIAYKTGVVSSQPSPDAQSNQDLPPGVSVEAVGIAGLLQVSSSSWLVAITKREPVAEIKGRQIYVITDIALIPLSSKSKAESAINAARRGRGGNTKTPVEDAETDEEDSTAAVSDDDVSDIEDPQPKPSPQRRSSIAEDVIGKKGAYGRFAERWFSRRGWQADQRRQQGMSTYEEEGAQRSTEPLVPATGETEAKSLLENEGVSPARALEEGVAGIAVSEPSTEAGQQLEEEMVKNVATTLTPKLLRTTKLLLASSKSFFFSYDYDITRSLAKQQPQRGGSSLPLYKLVDPEFWWNRHLLAPFTDGNNDQFALPLMQGFVGQAHFQVPSNEGATRSFLFTLISRRSVKRAGLRYSRRGVDEQGNVANCVETEQMLTDVDKSTSYSYVQLRGSIPVFFKQTPYAFKPKPFVHQTEEVTKRAFQAHFNRLHERYGGTVQAVNLVEKKSQEAIVGDLFEKYAKEMDDPKIDFEWFDFHKVCRGMKFENVSQLIDTIDPVMDRQGWTEESEDGTLKRIQTGIVRTNCMDCLDRTNVVQSACGRYVIEKLLEKIGVNTSELEATLDVLNLTWADNGDAVSKQYSSTAALKGDYTRTRKRGVGGALNDFGLTLTRFWNNVIGDFFTQTAIDYLLGNVNEQIFVEFESRMMSGDPAVSLKKLRQTAIETSAKIVIEDESEETLGAWTLSVPQEESTLRTAPFKDAVLLLTDAAVYFCRFDFQMDKVSSFTRIDLLNIKKIRHGTYITSTFTSSATDPKLNYGFVIHYSPGRDTSQRINTRTLTSTISLNSRPSTAVSTSTAQHHSVDSNTGVRSSDTSLVRLALDEPFLAFKALHLDSAVSSDPADKDRKEPEDVVGAVIGICKEIERACLKGDHSGGDSAAAQGGSSLLEEEEIISLAEAKKSTGFFEQVGYNIRRLVWG